MSTSICIKRGTTDKIAEYTGKQGELVFDTEAKALYVMDGVNKGGHLLGIPEVIDGGIIPEPPLTLTVMVAGSISGTVESSSEEALPKLTIYMKDGSTITELSHGRHVFNYDELNIDQPIRIVNNDGYQGIGFNSGHSYDYNINLYENITESPTRAIALYAQYLYIADTSKSASFIIG